MGDEDRWTKLEQIVRRVVREELAVLGKKPKIELVNGQWVGITDTHLEAWRAAFGSVDLDSELKRAAAWIVSNPDKAPKKGAAFLQNWFSRTQDRSAIRSIPTRNNPPPNLCAYCGMPSNGSANGYRHCSRHVDNAMNNEKPQRFMAGVEANPVAGE